MITRQVTSYSNIDFLRGETILIDKPLELTSFDVIYRLRRIIKIKKIGHAGTLDPKATVLLIVCTGKSTKKIESFMGLPKEYTGTIILGEQTPSMDSETEVHIVKEAGHITREATQAAASELTGEIQQVPPMYSAVMKEGKRLYTLARKGETVERKPRNVTVELFEITAFAPPLVSFRVLCSKGTYIRVLAHDLGEKLGCGAYLSSLRRTKIGGFAVEDAVTLHEFGTIYRNTNSDINEYNENLS
ncbi:MAG: tRNA pseudouridine(55) synthase TruB [Ignavibacteriales bacterium UTCHB3]|nr:MAG: tRNA pseudouridine(55) synthase TruB [Ignavibacteriales bacterium UTCHB3]